MSFYGAGVSGPPQQVPASMVRNAGTTQQNLSHQLFNIGVSPNGPSSQMQFQSDHNGASNTMQMSASSGSFGIPPANFASISSVNLLSEQLNVGQILSQGNSTASIPLQGFVTSSGLNFSQQTSTLGAHAAATDQNQQQSQHPKQRVFTGTVTKTHDNFGFIDDEVFFQTSVVKGPVLPKEGDRVLVEADYNPSMPFKWNATRVQIVNIPGSSVGMSSSASKGSGSTVLFSKQAPAAPLISNSRNLPNVQQLPAASNSLSTFVSGRQSQMVSVNNRGTNQPLTPRNSSGMPAMPLMNIHASALRDSPRSSSRDTGRERGIREKDRDRDRDRDKDREKRRTSLSPKRQRGSRSSKDERGKEVRLTRSRDRSIKKKSPERILRQRTPPSNSVTKLTDKERHNRNRSVSKDKSEKGIKCGIVYSTSAKTRSRSRSKIRSRSSSPKRRANIRSSTHYKIEVPKFSLDMYDLSCVEIRRRYPNLYIPSDFFLAKATWMEHLPLNQPYSILHYSPIHIFRKNVRKIEIPDKELYPIKGERAEESLHNSSQQERRVVPKILQPHDADPIFKVKVMLLNGSGGDNFYRKSCTLAEDKSNKEDRSSLDKILSFVVGVKMGKHETMALGGCWSPSLDGRNPECNPQVLVNTAVRCVKVLTGLDLSECRTWYRFMELYYRRGNGNLETVVFLLPDIWSAVPSSSQWSIIKSHYLKALYGEEYLEKKAAGLSSTQENQHLSGSHDGSNADNQRKEVGRMRVENEFKGEWRGMDSAEKRMENLEKDLNATNEDKQTAVEVFEQKTTIKEDIKTGEIGDSSIDVSQPTDRAEDVEMKEESDNKIKEEDVIFDAITTQASEGGHSSNTSHFDIYDCLIGDSKSEDSGTETKSVIPEDMMKKLEPAVKNEQSKEDEELETENNVTISDSPPQLLPAVSLLPKLMNVAQLREELNRRGLSTKGLKSTLIIRLNKALKQEEEAKELDPKNQNEIPEIKNEEMQVIDECTEENAPENIQEEQMRVTRNQKDELSQELCIDENENDDSTNVLRDDDKDEGEIEDSDKEEDAVKENAHKETEVTPKQHTSEKEAHSDSLYPVIKDGMSENEKKMWERRYELPKNPRILIHPNPNVKKGEFDCMAMTLSSLRDYSLNEKKEEAFEVSLFAEQFYEMLQRDFGFRIYLEVLENSMSTDNGRKSNSEKSKEKGAKNDNKEKSNKEKDDTNKDTEPPAKKRKLSSDSSSAVSYKTVDPYLLLSFMFFDKNNCEYISQSDLEDLFYALGLSLTRSQIHKLITKAIKGNLNYRNWTDRPSSERQGIKENALTAKSEQLLSICKGNKGLLPVFGRSFSGKHKKCVRGENIESVIVKLDDEEINVRDLKEHAERAEEEKMALEASLNVLKNSLNDAKLQLNDVKRTNENLKSDLTKTKESLKKAEASDKSNKGDLEVMKRAAQRFMERIKDVVKANESSCDGVDQRKDKDSEEKEKKDGSATEGSPKLMLE